MKKIKEKEKSKNAEQALKETRDELAQQAWALEKTNEAIKFLYKELEIKNVKLKELDKLKSEFVSMASHELRTPLTAIMEGVAIVADGTAGALNKDQKDFLNTAKRNVERLNRLINDILDLQKLEAGKMEFKMEKGDINRPVEEVAKAMAPLIKKKKLDFTVSLAKNMPKITFDSDKITQVLTNLVNNAVKVTGRGRITIATSKKSDNAICVSVSDTGPGIKKEDMDRLFKSFSQIPPGRGSKIKGTGLGLAISKKIIDEHRGKMTVESKYGTGSTFSFILPVRKRKG